MSDSLKWGRQIGMIVTPFIEQMAEDSARVQAAIESGKSSEEVRKLLEEQQSHLAEHRLRMDREIKIAFPEEV